ncbi:MULTISPECIES: HAD family hydrolase [unclassified Butyrivibrio]|uniref:HAD family hydrolase n=1 Tax=unclassified Butyrivibrio TaxID=2639466 RepID=UPI0003B4E47B|nr:MULTISPECIES: HAD family hydrolase [unclassified Butyrivibrio]MDC7294480.1 HAD family hydrolase [Butyrivibrio sp. DSM 10294]
MKYSTIIFDMDGTLLDTIEDITDSLNYVMERNGLNSFSIDRVKHMVGSGSAVLIERALEGGRENPDFDRILSEYSEYYEAHCNIKTGPYHHIPELLQALKNKGYKLAIVSNKPMAAVEELRKAYFDDFVEVAIGVTDKLRRKPYPDECLFAMEELHSSKEECIYVGDSEIDHQTAVNTGLKCISCLWGFRTKQELLDAGAGDNYFVNDPLEILDIIC